MNQTINRNYQQMLSIPGNRNANLNNFFGKIDNIHKKIKWNDNKFNINVKDENNNTILHRIIINSLNEEEVIRKINLIPMIETLINVQNTKGQTPLHLLCKYQYYDAYNRIKDIIENKPEEKLKLENYEIKIDESKDNKSKDNKNNKIKINYHIQDNKNRIPLSFIVKGIKIKENKSNLKIDDEIEDKFDIEKFKGNIANIYNALVDNKKINNVIKDNMFKNNYSDNENIKNLIVNNKFERRFINKKFFDEIINNTKVDKVQNINVDGSSMKNFIEGKDIKTYDYSGYYFSVCHYIYNKLVKDNDDDIIKVRLINDIREYLNCSHKTLNECINDDFMMIIESDIIFYDNTINDIQKIITGGAKSIINIITSQDKYVIDNYIEYLKISETNETNICLMLFMNNVRFKNIDVPEDKKKIISFINSQCSQIKKTNYIHDAILYNKIKNAVSIMSIDDYPNINIYDILDIKFGGFATHDNCKQNHKDVVLITEKILDILYNKSSDEVFRNKLSYYKQTNKHLELLDKEYKKGDKEYEGYDYIFDPNSKINARLIVDMAKNIGDDIEVFINKTYVNTLKPLKNIFTNKISDIQNINIKDKNITDLLENLGTYKGYSDDTAFKNQISQIKYGKDYAALAPQQKPIVDKYFDNLSSIKNDDIFNVMKKILFILNLFIIIKGKVESIKIDDGVKREYVFNNDKDNICYMMTDQSSINNKKSLLEKLIGTYKDRNVSNSAANVDLSILRFGNLLKYPIFENIIENIMIDNDIGDKINNDSERKGIVITNVSNNNNYSVSFTLNGVNKNIDDIKDIPINCPLAALLKEYYNLSLIKDLKIKLNPEYDNIDYPDIIERYNKIKKDITKDKCLSVYENKRHMINKLWMDQ